MAQTPKAPRWSLKKGSSFVRVDDVPLMSGVSCNMFRLCCAHGDGVCVCVCGGGGGVWRGAL